MEYIIDFCFTLKTNKDFSDITTKEFINAAKKRLDDVEIADDIEAFGIVDVISEEE